VRVAYHLEEHGGPGVANTVRVVLTSARMLKEK
jgi:hypothetical protein